MENIRIGILGYGNLGRAVERIVEAQNDMELVGVYSRRKLDHPLWKSVPMLYNREPIDVLVLCGGSATDLPHQTPAFASLYNIVDSFDHHQEIEHHYKRVDRAAKEGNHLALISCGWDPGLLSMIRVLFSAVFKEARVLTFWGKGISQGHSDAIRRIKGVKDARQYTVPLEPAAEVLKSFFEENHEPSATELHRRECYVVAEDGADLQRIENEIRSMPDYFAGYDTTVHFISQEKLEKNHGEFPHGGTVMCIGAEATGTFRLELSSNPDFTAAILISYVRAVYQMWKEGENGCKTVLEVPLSKLCQDIFIHM